ncbi:MAG: PLP-dependent transferase, partial [Bdellovibrionales bacterium]|nr:PLP-dependent transferase [Bdellovibrionales bacterium]
MKEVLKFATLAVHAGQEPDPAFGAVMTPVYQTSTYRQKEPGVYPGDYDYSRAANPTRTALQENLAALEGGKFGVCFSSGQAAQAAIVHQLKSGDHVVLCDDVYGGTFRQFDKIFKQLGINYTLVDMHDLAAVE